MRLVTDAMEKDLANADLLVPSPPCLPTCSQQKRNQACEAVLGAQAPDGTYTQTADNFHNLTASCFGDNNPDIENLQPGSVQNNHIFIGTDRKAGKRDICSTREGLEAEEYLKLHACGSQRDSDLDLQMDADNVPPRKSCKRGSPQTEEDCVVNGAHGFFTSHSFRKMASGVNVKKFRDSDEELGRHSSERENIVGLHNSSVGFTDSLYNVCLSRSNDNALQSFARMKDLNFTMSNGYFNQNDERQRGKQYKEMHSSSLFSSSRSCVDPGVLVLSTQPVVLDALKRLHALMGRPFVKTIPLEGSSGVLRETNLSEMAGNTLTCLWRSSLDHHTKQDTEDRALVDCANTEFQCSDFKKGCTLQLDTDLRNALHNLERIGSDSDTCKNVGVLSARPVAHNPESKPSRTSQEKDAICSKDLITGEQEGKNPANAEDSCFLPSCDMFPSLRPNLSQSQTHIGCGSIPQCVRRSKSDMALAVGTSRRKNTVDSARLTKNPPDLIAVLSNTSVALKKILAYHKRNDEFGDTEAETNGLGGRREEKTGWNYASGKSNGSIQGQEDETKLKTNKTENRGPFPSMVNMKLSTIDDSS
ncbi:hypothetical protein ElyMa_005464600 [Elysia marginata]|uniref:Uncharacterized protein n=1 Tax=Elysia marginata TaxID=1093978 RepID=A0AAV4EPB6_9GAST|nr:hypothetical protein ElyMa_005464600 [Elysia marginata]